MTDSNSRTTCYLLGYVDPETRTIESVSLHSESPMTITRDFNRHGLVEILSAGGADYQSARHNVLSMLRQFEHTKSFAWISKLYERELQVSGGKFELQEWAAAAPVKMG